MKHSALGSLAACLLAACASPPEPTEITPLVTPERCATAVFALDAAFPSAGMASCSIVGDRTIEIHLVPEDVPINPSPWYAVRLTPAISGTVRVVLRYEEHPHRYKPKVSRDGVAWSVLPDDRVDIAAEGFRATLELDLDLDLDEGPLFVAAQELFTNGAHDAWADRVGARADVALSRIGASIEGRPIEMLTTTADADVAPTLMLVGRQHPPEISGALAMTAFMEELLSDSDLAETFRGRFNIVMVPNMNPDGVEHGYWRHNMGGLDLNRDWGPFTQPETQAVKAVLDAIDADASQDLVVFLDFHSTRRNVFYTQPVGEDGTDYGFTAQWLANSGARLPNYEFGRQGSHNLDLPTSKTYVFERFGVPTITYELGDETDRDLVRQSAAVFAQELMALLLEREGE